MSSTGNSQRGQALAIFALSLTAVLLAAALAFDVGSVMLERRDQQNAADAAAMAGVRYIAEDRAKARNTAFEVGTLNGFDNDIEQVVTVNIPPRSGQWSGWPNTIEVIVSSTRPSLFAGIAGILDWPVSARAVAMLSDGMGATAAILALDPTSCGAVYVGGNGGKITAKGNLQVNSDCPTHALHRGGDGDVILESPAQCIVVGGVKDAEGFTCEIINVDVPFGDPFAKLPPVPPNGYPRAVEQVPVGSKKIPNGCPGSNNPATLEAPATCQFPSNYKDTTWRLFPGVYPGGLKFLGGTYLLEPGIYWIGGGGLSVAGGEAELRSVAKGGTEFGGGVLLYNTQLPVERYPDDSAAGSVMEAKTINLGGGTAKVHLAPLQEPPPDEWFLYQNMVIFQAREVVLATAVDINGNASENGLDVLGTIYVPHGEVSVNGNEGQTNLDQIIAWTFKANGNGGNINATREEDRIYQFSGAGLVE